MPAVGINEIDGVVAQAIFSCLMQEMSEYAGVFIEPVQPPVISADPKDTVAVGEQGIETIGAGTVGIGRNVFIMVKAAGLCIELVQSVSICRNPYRSLTVIGDRVYIVPAEAIAVGIVMFVLMNYLSVLSDHRYTVTPGACPQIAFSILAQAEDIIAADAFTGSGAMYKMPEFPRRQVHFIEPASIRTHPQMIAVLEDVEHIVVGKTFRRSGVFVMIDTVDALIVQVDAAVCRADPQIALGVAVQRIDRVITETGIVDVVMCAGDETIHILVQDTDAAIFRSDPKISLIVLFQRKDHIRYQAACAAAVIPEMPESSMQRIQQIQPAVPHSDPQPVTAVFQDPFNRIRL